VRVQVWKFIGVTMSLNVIHDVRQSLRTQVRQTLMFGVVQGF
jgi:hypothetical protein